MPLGDSDNQSDEYSAVRDVWHQPDGTNNKILHTLNTRWSMQNIICYQYLNMVLEFLLEVDI